MNKKYLNDIKESFFSIGFRPFFFLAALIATLNPTLWASYLIKDFHLPLYVSPLFWHGHEMVFGFTSALIAGFILTASANWTGTKPYQGKTLFFLSIFWLLERFVYLVNITPLFSLILTHIFYPLLISLLYLKLRDFPKQKYVFIPLLSFIYISSFCHSYGYFFENDVYEEMGLNTGTSLITLLLFLIAGRILPFFTSKKTNREITISSIVHKISLAPLALLCLPIESSYYVAPLLLLAFLSHSYRNYLMFKKEVLKIPMLWIIHLGLFFLTFSLLTRLVSIFSPEINDHREVLHLVFVGGLGLTSLGIMTRVSLGHTGRIIKANKGTVIAYLSIFIAALLRCFIPYFFPEYYEIAVYIASKFWALGFILFLILYSSFLFMPRADKRSH